MSRHKKGGALFSYLFMGLALLLYAGYSFNNDELIFPGAARGGTEKSREASYIYGDAVPDMAMSVAFFGVTLIALFKYEYNKQYNQSRNKSLYNILSGVTCIFGAAFLVSSGLEMKKIASITDEPLGPVVAKVYQHCKYQGYEVKLKPGLYNLSLLTKLGMKNDDISSLKVSPGYEVVLHREVNFNGPRKVYDLDVYCFIQQGINDSISSIVVRRH
ncbi:hypothetical protein [Spartinivicinus ruber]|uniref:hypothetical protein n=1 Tax=Spartinivicinus ruber TaxID=2683272 RepID=UPI0013D69AC6|nr:hypothetical protein [Spartinivicinus ruber]